MMCTYCGEVKAPWTKDHIPPQSIIGFDHNHTVPSCMDCNRGSSKDDEYFLFAVTMAKSCDEHPNISGVRRRVFRSLGKEKARQYRNLILRNADADNLRHDEIDFGNYLERIKSVGSRIVKGLYFLKTDADRIPDTHQISIFIGNEYKAYGSRNVEKLQSLFKPLLAVDEQTIGDAGVFDYLFSRLDDADPYATVWYLRFYGGYELFIYSLPNGDPRALATHFWHPIDRLPKLATIYVPSCGELSQWVARHLGKEIEQSPVKKQLPQGVIPILRGQLGKYREADKQ